MKIQITGYSSSGKSTFAKRLEKHYHLPLLHIDKIYFKNNWEKRDRLQVEKEISDFTKKENWIIDGQYRYLVPERYELADHIFIFNFNRFKCLYGAIKRRIKYRKKQRDSIAEGCRERLNLSFVWWILWEGRKKDSRNLIKSLITAYPDKTIVFKGRRQVNRYLKSIGFTKYE
jgi:adenylate kinase family enzyme